MSKKERAMRRHKYRFIAERKGAGGFYNTSFSIVTIRHSRYGEQKWILRETNYPRQCDGTGRAIEAGEQCYSLMNYDASPNRKARLSVEFIEQLKQTPNEDQ